MKKIFSLAATVVLGSALLLAGCGNDSAKGGAASGDKVTITVGASPVPHAEILEQVKPLLEKEGINLKITEFTDYVTPNIALNDKELDANFFQHVPYLEKFANEHNLKLASAGKVHVEPMGIYSKTVTDKDLKSALPNGSKVAIPNDPTNGARALILLEKAGLIKLKDASDIGATKADITDNPRNLEIVELEAPQLPRSLDDVAIAVINTNYALEAGLNPLKDALLIEDKDSPYANIVAVRAGDENRPEIQKLIKALESPEIKKFIDEKYKGAIIPAF
ncbi:MetQ/NlpA family ABC transporter substrate-binding protein [uncultured Veillonella sp.]|uniref:MetQ/NlpA family ABC transporter substrate-binding protein n=1 Tax=uncultured Veillonella sp. TaxID=159268 RepID=UPI0025CEB04D|nr:MetQ/NlpA family ABC transporter substrate-binding protein [uncultured Veillonella sp.]MDY3974140.1 MetQ/NlpA family ABC transporter substrate-binding protein [Veillonella caviae]